MSGNESDVIIFSKDRPWQLQQLIKSIFTFTDFRSINVVFKSGKEYKHNYSLIKEEFSGKVNFIEDGPSINKAFIYALSCCSNAVALMADDLIFFDKFSSCDSISFMKSRDIFSYHFKLHPDYDYCHSVSRKQFKPEKMEKKTYHWAWGENDGTWDWYYPFDITGSMYIKKDLKKITAMINEECKRGRRAKNPNDIEMIGGEIVFSQGINIFGKELMACPDRRCCACISLNHVNDFSFSPINPSEECTLNYINTNIFGKYEYDTDYFKNLDQRSCHITDYRLRSI